MNKKFGVKEMIKLNKLNQTIDSYLVHLNKGLLLDFMVVVLKII